MPRRAGPGSPFCPRGCSLDIPLVRPSPAVVTSCLVTLERGKTLALGAACFNWPVLLRPRLAGFQVSTEGLAALICACLDLGLAGMHGHANEDGGGRLPRLGDERALRPSAAAIAPTIWKTYPPWP
jgi:hypothetical protein